MKQKCSFFLHRLFSWIYRLLLKLRYHSTRPSDIVKEEWLHQGYPSCRHKFSLVPWDTKRHGPPHLELLDSGWLQPSFILFENRYRCSCGAEIIRMRRVTLT